MIRKTIIVLLMLAAVSTALMGLAGFYGVSLQWLSNGWHWEAMALKGNLVIQGQELQEQTLRRFRNHMTSAIVMESGQRIRDCWASIGGRSSHLFPWKGGAPKLVLASIPMYIPFILLAGYPTIAFIRAPWRRYRRRKKGHCIKCAYDLTGNESRTCPECGEVIKNTAHND